MNNLPPTENSQKDNTTLQCYKVGGAVRDALLHQVDSTITIKEIDWVVIGSSAQQMLDLGFKQVGKNFPVFLHPKTKDEYALARIEKKQGKGYHGFTFDTSQNITLEEDLSRRDLTINAIAQDPQNPAQFIDPYGGIKDIENRLLKHIGDAFDEDPLRVFRVARFYARYAYLGFNVHPLTKKKMQQMSKSGEIKHLFAERVWQETQLALQTRSPSLFFKLLHEVNALNYWFPEIERLFGIPQPFRWHPEIDCGVHSLMVLEQAASLTEDVAIRFCALTHDLGKGTTPNNVLPSHHGHEKRGVPLVKNLCNRIHVPKQIKKLAMLAAQWHTHFHRYQEMKAETYLKVLLSINFFHHQQNLYDLLMVSESDSKGRTGSNYKCYESKRLWLKIAEQLSQFETTKPNQNSDFLSLNNEEKKQTIHDQRLHIITKVIHEFS